MGKGLYFLEKPIKDKEGLLAKVDFQEHVVELHRTHEQYSVIIKDIQTATPARICAGENFKEALAEYADQLREYCGRTDIMKHLILRRMEKGRREEECMPKQLTDGKLYRFIKRGLKNFKTKNRTKLRELHNDEYTDRAWIYMQECSYVLNDPELGHYTKGTYRVLKVLDPADARNPLNEINI
jgi:hypothetical protein